MLVMRDDVYLPLSVMNIALVHTQFVKCTDIFGDQRFSMNTEYCMQHYISVIAIIRLPLLLPYMKHDYFATKCNEQ